MQIVRYDWAEEEALKIYNMPLLELIYKAATVHRQFHDPSEVQLSSLLSIKTGACSEDCAYCPQAARYSTGIKIESLLPIEKVVESAKNAKLNGSTRFCMGAAWREIKDNDDFENVLEMVKAVNDLGMEVCCTLGMLTESQARRLKEAGLYAYNHNIDTSEEFYERIITTRTFQDRLRTLENVRKAGITVCCGGIIGMGESVKDRIKMLLTLSYLHPHPESVPINALVPIKGTPLGNRGIIQVWEMVRMIATARIMLPKSMVRLSAGRLQMSKEAQALCFLAGANSIFAGDKLLTTPNPEFNDDMKMLNLFGLRTRKAFKESENLQIN
ncbi:biotin synthase BioB [Candidatus Woesearchaeota archaeon]|nr:biotin synthase BioB [Candidatus Woesearchaeota archaeon]